MQPTELQVERSLAALRQDVVVVPDRPAVGSALATPSTLVDLPPGLLELLAGTPPVRADRLAEARLRLAAGDVPTDEELAGRMVGRIVCDRLR